MHGQFTFQNDISLPYTCIGLNLVEVSEISMLAVVLLQLLTLSWLPTVNVIIDLGASAGLVYRTRKYILECMKDACAGVHEVAKNHRLLQG